MRTRQRQEDSWKKEKGQKRAQNVLPIDVFTAKSMSLLHWTVRLSPFSLFSQKLTTLVDPPGLRAPNRTHSSGDPVVWQEWTQLKICKNSNPVCKTQSKNFPASTKFSTRPIVTIKIQLVPVCALKFRQPWAMWFDMVLDPGLQTSSFPASLRQVTRYRVASDCN